jgi:phosphate/phosphite/phosphonate ABC transporter binding protein
MLIRSKFSRTFFIFVFCVLIYSIPISCQRADDSVALDFNDVMVSTSPSSSDSTTLNVAISAMTSPQETYSSYKDLLGFISERTGREIQLKQRKTYKEINDLLLSGELDMAFICTGAYADKDMAGKIHLLAVPQINGKTTYQSYLIVPVNSEYESLNDLRGLPFAFTDPLSLTGCSITHYQLLQEGISSDKFFSSTIYTHGHDNSIKAVSRGMVQGANIDGLIFDYFAVRNPMMIHDVKVLDRSEPFGIPPVVVPNGIDEELENGLRVILTTMHNDELGREILSSLLIDRFTTEDDSIYNSIRSLLSSIEG